MWHQQDRHFCWSRQELCAHYATAVVLSLTRYRCSSFTNCLSVLTCITGCLTCLTSRCQPKNFIFHLVKNKPFCSQCTSVVSLLIPWPISPFWLILFPCTCIPNKSHCCFLYNIPRINAFVRLILCLYYHNNLLSPLYTYYQLQDIQQSDHIPCTLLWWF